MLRYHLILNEHFLFSFSGYLGPGGIQDNLEFKDCAGGMAGYIDKYILGQNHIYQHPTIAEVYHSGPFDPEGILGKNLFFTFLRV